MKRAKIMADSKEITRRSFLSSAVTAFVGLTTAIKATGRRSSKTYEFVNGSWFDGQKFASKKFYSTGGFLTSEKPARIDSTIDLTGKYVIPPFGEAHNHNVENSERVAEVTRKYLQEGVLRQKSE